MTQTDKTSALRILEARRLLEGDNNRLARDTLKPITDAEPNNAEAWLQLARAEAAMGRPRAARAAFERCLTLSPKEPVAWMEFACFEGQFKAGGKLLARAKKAGLPSTLLKMIAAAVTGQGARAISTGVATPADLAAISKAAAVRNLREVETRVMTLLRKRQGAVLWGLLGQARFDAKQYDKAIEAFRAGIKLEPYAADLRQTLVKALVLAEDEEGAAREARLVAQMAPASKTAQIVYGRMSNSFGMIDQAAEIAERLLKLYPTDDTVLKLAAQALTDVGEADRAVEYAKARTPTLVDYDLTLANAYNANGNFEEAKTIYDSWLEKNPEDANILSTRGSLKQTLGDKAGGEADLRAAIALAPDRGSSARALAYGVKLAADDPAVLQMVERYESGELTSDSYRAMGYALARVFQKHDPKRAAAYLAEANALTLARYPYDPKQPEIQFRKTKEYFWPALDVARKAGSESTCDGAPIFVTGMPRSGTTLVETILATHDDVAAGGELGVLNRSSSKLFERLSEDGMTKPVTSRELTAAGEAYMSAADRAAVEDRAGRRMTDKSIASYYHFGLIQSILPKAKIVVLDRDPRDNGLSIWRNQFRDGSHTYAQSQEGIATQIEWFQKSLAYWEEQLPGSFYRISYQKLVNDPETECRALLDFVGLDWDPKVLSFHKTERSVKTLSFSQVRQPMYKSSSGGWQDAQEEIADLIKALERKGLLPD